MESAIAQSLQKGFERERWEVRRNFGCATTDELFWKLNALQTFISDLHWPDDMFAKHLDQRLKLLACEMLETLLHRTLSAFQSWEKKGTRFGTATDYIIPAEMCVMVNVVLETRNQSLKLCTFDGVDMVSGSSRHLYFFRKTQINLLYFSFFPYFFCTFIPTEPVSQQNRSTWGSSAQRNANRADNEGKIQ
jgi:hypothetical protein